MRWRASLAALALASAAQAAALAAAPEAPPGAVETLREIRERAAFAMPVRPFDPAAPMARTMEGALSLHALRIDGPASSLAVALDYRERLEAAGFALVLFCAAPDCGGFDFRAGLTVAPQPAMRVDLIDFHQLTMRRDATWVSVLTSGDGEAVFAQVATLTDARALPEGDGQGATAPTGAAVSAAAEPVGPDPGAAPEGEAPGDAAPGVEPPGAEAPRAEPSGAGAPPSSQADEAGAALDRLGHVVLESVAFATGSADLAPGGEAALDAAAAALATRTGRRFVVVGHTDSSGDLAVNQRISAQRASAVRAALIARGVPAGRLEAEGAGWLAPRASNADEAGRALNRRVEIVER